MSTLNQKRISESKRKKRRFIIMLTAVEIIVSVWVASVLDYVLTYRTLETSAEILQITWFASLKNIFANSNIRMLWLAMQGLYIAFIFYITYSIRPELNRVDTKFITPQIEVPIPAGNGQHGNERFLTEAEKEELFEILVYDRKEHYPQYEGRAGMPVQMIQKGNKQYIYYYPEDVHSLVVGATGSGKTRRLLLVLLWLQMVFGQSAVITDVKGELFYYTSPLARRIGYRTLDFDLRNPKKSVHYNYLQPILNAFAAGNEAAGISATWDLVSVLVGEPKGEPLWTNGECATIAAGILVVVIEAPEEYRNMTNVYYFIAYMCQANAMDEMPLNLYLETLPDNHPAKGVFAMATIAADKTRSSFFTSALGTLRLFTDPNIAEMTSSSDFQLEDVASSKTLLYMMVSDEKETYYPLVSIFFTQLYMAQVEQANTHGGRLPIETDYDIDEFGLFPKIPVAKNIASAGRSRGIRMHIVVQDYEQGSKKYKDDWENIKTNCQLKLYLKSDNEKTLKSISDTLGNYTVEVSSASTSASDGKRNDVNYSSSSSLTGRKLLEPAEIQRIKQPYSICMVTGEYAAINKLPDLSDYYINRNFGLGDKKHNQKLIMERETARPERDIPPVKLWKIWTKYQEQMDAAESERVSFI